MALAGRGERISHVEFFFFSPPQERGMMGFVWSLLTVFLWSVFIHLFGVCCHDRVWLGLA